MDVSVTAAGFGAALGSFEVGPAEALGGAAALALVLAVWGYLNPPLGRFLARSFAVVAMGLGVGLLVWGIVAAARGEQPPAAGPPWGAAPGAVIGCGAGALTAGIVALVLSCVGAGRGPPPPPGRPGG